ncbi:MAG: GntR family transcriptional regulator [Betaproteobacteria bacterium]
MSPEINKVRSEDKGFQIRVPSATPSLYEQVYASILDAICGGDLRPGDRINQDELAAHLNVSRQPVTQALTVLRTQGFVQDAGRRGLVVAPLRRSFFGALYQLRESLDPMAARLAARNNAKLLRADGLALLERGRAALQTGSVADLTSADMAFHMWIYEAAENPLLTEMLRMYWHHMRRAMIVVVGQSDGRNLVWRQHEQIVEAILNGKEKLAETLSTKHIQAAARRVIQSIPE